MRFNFDDNHYSITADRLLSTFGAYDDDRRAHGYRAFCPVHEKDGGHDPSLIVDFTEEGKALILCQSRHCDLDEILAEVGLTRAEICNVSHITQTVKGTRQKAAASPEQRQTLEGRAFKASLELDKMRRESDPVALAIAERFGLSEGYSPSELGIGYEGREDGGGDFVVYTRTADGHVAWLQRRDLDDPDGGWMTASNPDKGTDNEARWDAYGVIGRWRGSGPVLIAEGASDAVTLAALDSYDVIALRGATMADRIEEVKDLILDREIVVLADEDPAGEKMTRSVLDLSDPYVASAHWVRWGTEIRGYDVRDFRAQSPDSFKARLARVIDKAEIHYREGGAFNAEPYVGRSDEGAASAIRDYVRSLGYDLAFARGAGWMLYDGTRWIAGAEGAVHHLATRLARNYSEIVNEEARSLRSEAVMKAGNKPAQLAKALSDVNERLKPKYAFISGLQTANTLRGILRILEGHPTIGCELTDFDRDPDVIAVANGVVELRTGKLRKMRPSDRITARLSTAYREGAKAPRFEEFLREIFVDGEGQTDEELVAYMRRLIGYAITGHSSEQSFWLLHSPRGANGKSQFLGILNEVFREVTQSTSFSTFESRSGNDNAALSDLASLRNARIVLGSEGSGKALNEDRIKAITGEDEIKAKFMRQDLFGFKAKFALLLATNKIPEFSSDPAIWRRIKIVPFLRHFKEHEQVKGIGHSIAESEAEGILALAVAEAARWFADGLPECHAITSRTQDEREDSDPLALFLAMNVEEGDGPRDGNVLLVDLWHRFRLWSEAMGDGYLNQEGVPTTSRQLKKELVARWDLPSNRTVKGTRTDAYPVRWAGRRLIAPAIVNERFNAMRADALGMTDYMSAGARALELGEDPGVAKYANDVKGLVPRNAG